MKSFRVATFNAHHGKDSASIYTHDGLIESVESLNADILFMQELDTLSIRTYFGDQPKKIARALGYNYATCRVRFFGFGFQHNAIFSRFPIIKTSEVALPLHGNQQFRNALLGDIEIGDKKLHVATTHLHTHKGKSRYNDWAQKQLDYLLEKHYDCDACLIGGDLNLLPKEVVPVAHESGYDAPHEFYTSPAIGPKMQIDWLLGKSLKMEDVHTSDVLSSDHRALIATVVEIA